MEVTDNLSRWVSPRRRRGAMPHNWTPMKHRTAASELMTDWVAIYISESVKKRALREIKNLGAHRQERSKVGNRVTLFSEHTCHAARLRHHLYIS